MRKAAAVRSGWLGLGAMLSMQAAAQPADAGVEPSEEAALDTVVVTARKKTEALQKVPMSVLSFDATAQRQRALDSLDALGDAVPGLQQGDLAITSRMSLRGVNSGDNNAFEQAVGVYVDGLYRGRMNQQHIGLFDLERIEVLRGPQVALYGNSSIGGAISAMTRKPGFQREGELGLGYEAEYRTWKVRGGADLPVSETLALRVAGTWRDQQQGLFPNAASGRSEPKIDDEAARISALWLPGERTSLALRHEQARHQRDGHIFDVFKHVDGQGNPWPGSPFTGLGDNRLDIGNGAPFQYTTAFQITEMDETLAELVYEADSWTLTSISGHSAYDYRHSADVDLTPATLINVFQDETFEQFSQELRVSGQASPSLDYLFGLYWQQEDFRNDYLSDFNLPALIAPAFGLPTDLVGGLLEPFSRHILLDQQTRQSAIFGHLDWAFAEDWRAALGLRLQRTRKDAFQAVRGAGLDHVDGPGPLVDLRWLDPQIGPGLLANPAYLADPTRYVLVLPDGTTVGPLLAPNHLLGYSIVSNGRGTPHEFGDLSRRETQPMLQASLSWQADPGLLLYAGWSNGAKAGGFDFLYEGGNRDEVEYGDESASVFELGLKHQGPRLRLNLAAFHGSYDDLQVSVFDGGIGFVVGNAASSTSQGLEVDLVWQLTEHWRLRGNASWVDFRYDHFPDANCSTTERLNTGQVLCDWSSRRTPFVPELEGVFGIEQDGQLGAWQFTHTLQWRYTGDHATASDLEVQTRQSAYSLFDYRIELRPQAASWSVALAARNLTDRRYDVFTSVIPLAPGGAFAHVRAPGRTVELELSLRF
ncbi:TonB-dependent receptor [Pseudomarimonas salicorniae]|uniref:TonB-dependent receptor n=1 Tax=Pseudomarimonas salicorniae TaxID=2933270 RepID=A0ABT0GF03_9GAMM|nr:TonB-dependent receptor [Lysobacter sp. CAU 1642]MCK7593008.1 TonB-dependent receptor [Lysobacter sp. CAU 1642]